MVAGDSPSLLLASLLVTRLDELTNLIAAYKASLVRGDRFVGVAACPDNVF